MNYSFLLKCLAGIALFTILLALLAKPTFIVAAATAGLAATATAGLFIPIIPIIAAALLIAALCTIPVVAYRGPQPGGAGFYTYNPFMPAFWFGPTYATYSWLDYWNRPLFTGNTHIHRGGGILGGGPLHTHNNMGMGATRAHHNGLFAGHKAAHTTSHHTNGHSQSNMTSNNHTSTHHSAGHSAFGGNSMFSGHSAGHSGFSGGHSASHSFSAPSMGHSGGHHH